jgi:hypothetical protein
MKKIIFAFLLMVIAVGGVAGYLFLTDRITPEIQLSPDSEVAAPKRAFTIKLRDPGAGLKSAKVVVTQGDKQITLLDQNYATPVKEASETFTLEPAGLRDGPFSLRVTATDRSIANFGAGNTATLTRNCVLDTIPPRIEVTSLAHNVRQGGVGAVSFSLSEEPESAGVMVGDDFYPAFKMDNGRYFGLFVFPYDMAPKDFAPWIKAVDKAGNVARGTFRYQAIPRKFRQDKLNISDNFLDAKMPQYYEMIPDTRDNLQIYLRVNKEVRKQNRKHLQELGLDTAPRML